MQLIETLCLCRQSMRITADPFVNSTDFLNITTTVKPNHHEEEINYNWLFGVGIFLFFLCIVCSRGNGKAAPNRRPQATPPQNRQTPPTSTPPATVSTATTPPANESSSLTPPVGESTSLPGPSAVSNQGMEGEYTYQNNSVSTTAPPPSYDSIMNHPSMPPPSYDTVVK